MISSAASLALPQLVDDRRHQPQHAARALELLERRPVARRAGRTARGGSGRRTRAAAGSRPPRASSGNSRRVLLVQVAERVDDRVALARQLGGHVLEQPPAHDLEALLRPTPASTTPPAGRSRSRAASSASLPASPPTSMSDAGIETTSIAFLTLFAASESACANVICVSNEPAGEVVAPVELARVGDPLVDQDQARRVALRAA